MSIMLKTDTNQSSSVFLIQNCTCESHQFFKLRFFSCRLPIDTPFDALPRYDGIADLIITGNEAHISGFVMSGYSRFRRMHDYDLEQQIRRHFPWVTVAFWERHKGGEVVKLMRAF